MPSALRLSATVQPGHRIEVTTPELPEGSRVELIITQMSAESYQRYPSVLEAEYDLLIEKKLDRALTSEEVCRLNDIRKVIAEIDRLTLQDDVRTRHLDQVEAELAQLRTEIESLPDA